MGDSSTAVTFTGLKFENPFLLASAPPTESESNISRAFEAGWGGVVCKTIGMHPVVNVRGPRTGFLRASADSYDLSNKKRPNVALHSSWNWELISDHQIDWWVPRIERIKKAHPTKMFVASVMAGSGSDKELQNWQFLAKSCQDAGADAIEMNLSCPHMDRKDMGSNIGKNPELCSTVTVAVKEAVKIPVWAKLTPSTTDIAMEAKAVFLGGADAVATSNTFPSLPLIDPKTLEFEMNVDGYTSSGGLGGPAILPQSLAKIATIMRAFPEANVSGIGGVANFDHALNYILLGCGTVQVCTAAMLDKAIGPNVIRTLLDGMRAFMDARGYTSMDEFRGIRRDRVVPQHEIARPESADYHGGHDAQAE